MPPRHRKIAVMGYKSVGKSSLIIRFVENQFIESYDPTIENTFSKNINIRGQEYILDMIDTCGQDEFTFMPETYSMNIDGYILVYSVDSQRSFEIAKVLYGKLVDMTGAKQLPVILVGNKTDLKSNRAIQTEEGRALALEWKATFIESSAKDNSKVEDVFKSVVQQIEGNGGRSDGCILS